ncbi:hypothetical protein BMS3Abin07_00572 [bacterium BMS3Abin07]|nr:hypothetical protein BMS3Abin07_00572 [bacterium BMS3Abin07]GBE32856.1 hypothetical protein BMS3Bbin05_01784 [bacterium BMS3Bbin05]HDO22396.1 DUF721 domain-containing protein [Nitrospirota bacterium]
MERISKAFNEILGELGIGKAVTVEILRNRWEEIIGETISLHTYPFSCNNGQLLINVDSPEWLHELQYHQETILSRLRAFDIDSVRFRLGRIIRRTVHTPPAHNIKDLTERDKVYAKDTVSNIKDPALKEKIKKAIEKSLAHAE